MQNTVTKKNKKPSVKTKGPAPKAISKKAHESLFAWKDILSPSGKSKSGVSKAKKRGTGSWDPARVGSRHDG